MLNIRALFRAAHPSGARTLYVSPTGSDGNGGTSASSPKRTIQSAVDAARAGDRISVASGTYGYVSIYGRQGTPTAWITIEGAVGARPVIDVSTPIASSGGSRWTDGIDVQQSAYVAVVGFEVRGSQTSPDTNPSGIAVFRGSRRISVWDCVVHDFPGGGINCFWQAQSTYEGQVLPGGGWDGVDVFFNTVHGTSRYSPNNTSGISFYGGEDLGVGTIDGRYGYRAVGNYVYDVVCTVPYTPGGLGFVTDGNGISPDSLAVANSLNPSVRPYRKRGLIEGNVIVACGGRGVHVFNSKDIDVVNNTLVGNLRTKSPAITGSTEVDLQLDTRDPQNGVVIANNLIAPTNTARAFDRTAQSVRGNTVVGGTDVVPAGNQSLRPVGVRMFSGGMSATALAAGPALSALKPSVQTLVARVPGQTGYQALGLGQQTGNSVAVGALPRR
ncbi:hypothetical protein [Curtobacterium sp. RRHDQ10]|uniref:hypothetical protein n=1 Tax=Curtobacterium phyllosphaerae TaxID=3413379 RepID=UPI003BF12ECE